MPGNEYAFIVENVGSETAEPFSVEFKTPPEITVLRAFPFNAEQSEHLVVVNFERLGAGKRSPVHIKTSAARHSDFVIETRIRTEKMHEFKVRSEKAVADDRARTTRLDPDRNETRVPYQLAATRNATLAGDPAAAESYETSVLDRVPQTGSKNAVQLSSKLVGPESLVLGQQQDFEITIANPSDLDATGIVVQLTLPEGLIVTNLDREAWIDQLARTISWKLDALGSMEMNKIRYQLKAVGAGDQLQRVVIGMNDVYQGEIRMTSSIIANTNEPLNLRPYLGN